MKQPLFVNQAQIVPGTNENYAMRVMFLGLRKQREPLMGLELMTDMHPPITSQMRHNASQHAVPWVGQISSITNVYKTRP